MTKKNQIRTGSEDKDFRVFEKDETMRRSFISLTMEIERPHQVSLNTMTYSYAEESTIASLSIYLDDDVETLKNLVKWTKNITRKANKQIKKLEK